MYNLDLYFGCGIVICNFSRVYIKTQVINVVKILDLRAKPNGTKPANSYAYLEVQNQPYVQQNNSYSIFFQKR